MMNEDFKERDYSSETTEHIDNMEENSQTAEDRASDQLTGEMDFLPEEGEKLFDEEVEDTAPGLAAGSESLEEAPIQIPEETGKQPGQKSHGRKIFKALGTEMIAGLVIGAMLVFGAGYGCGVSSAKSVRGQFQKQAVAEAGPGSSQDGPGSQNGREFGFRNDGGQGRQGKGGPGQGPGNWGGPGNDNGQQDNMNPPAGNVQPGSGDQQDGTGNGQPDQGTNQPGDSSQSKDNTDNSKDSPTQSKDSTIQPKDETSQPKNNTDKTTETSTQSL